jgi:hypothetical protein
MMPLQARHGNALLQGMLAQARAHANTLISAPATETSMALNTTTGDGR